jgi:hypothetical protein
MATPSQIKANQENAKNSIGPTSAAGSARSSQNATKHGWTGQTLLISPQEAGPYALHVEGYMERFDPLTTYHKQLVQQLADSDWGIHQVSTQQAAVLSLLHALTEELKAKGQTPSEVLAETAKLSRQLATLGTYEGRKRRASAVIKAELDEIDKEILSQEESAPAKSQETNAQPEIGFVYPENADHRESLRAYEELEAAMKQLEVESGVASEKK